MVDGKELKPRELTFSQAQGYEEIPGTLALEKVDYEARLKLWNLLYLSAWVDTMAKFGYWSTNPQWVPILETLHTDFFRRPIDDLDTSPSGYKGAILDVLPFYKLFDLLQIIRRHQNCPGKFIADVVKLFDECRLAYVVDTNGPATILPAVTEREGQAIVGALHELPGRVVQTIAIELERLRKLSYVRYEAVSSTHNLRCHLLPNDDFMLPLNNDGM